MNTADNSIKVGGILWAAIWRWDSVSKITSSKADLGNNRNDAIMISKIFYTSRVKHLYLFLSIFLWRQQTYNPWFKHSSSLL